MNVDDLKLFTRIADLGSISAAAQQMDMTPATASASLKRLESQLGAQLFIRSTRQLRITPKGVRFLEHSREALATLERGLLSIDTVQGEVSGTLRLSVSSDLGRNQVLPWIDEAMVNYPEVAIRATVSDSNIDFYSHLTDVGLRYGEPEDSSMVGFKIATTERVLCAAPSYLAKYAEPESPQDLAQHNCLLYSLSNRIFDLWKLNKNDEQFKVRVSGNRVCNDGDVVKRWAINGHGIAFKSRIDISQELASRKLVRLLPAYQSPALELWLICINRQQVTPAVHMLRDLLREKFTALDS